LNSRRFRWWTDPSI